MAADSDGESFVGFSPPTGCPSILIQNGAIRSHRTSSNLSRDVKEKATLNDNDLIQTVFTCQGNLEDPDFPKKFSSLLDKLSMLLCTGKEVLMKVKKVEPWNSVRVTLTIPRDAAQRLRTLAQAGDAALQALGILSVQVEGDRLISLRLASRFGGEPQEIVLRTGGETSNNSTNNGGIVSIDNSLGHIVGGTAAGGGANVSTGIFRSPNVVAPSGVGIPPSPKPHAGPPPFPFTSMNHAAQTQQGRDSNNQHNFTAPPPYPTKTYSPSGHKPAPTTNQNTALSATKKPVGLSSVNVQAGTTSTAKLISSSNVPSYSARDINSKPFTQKLPPPTSVQPGAVCQLKNVTSDSVLTNSNNSNNMSLSSPLLVNLLQNDGAPVTSTPTSSSLTAANKMTPPNPEQIKAVRKTSPEQSESAITDLDAKNYRSNFANNFNNKMTPKLLANSQARMPSSVRQRNPSVRTGFSGQLPGYSGLGPSGSRMPSVPNMNVIRQPGRCAPNLMKDFQQNPVQSGASTGRPNSSTVQRFSQIRAGYSNSEVRPNILVHGYSQYTASSSKPCSSVETADKNSENKEGVSDAKKLIINPLTGELEPMPSESSESEEESFKEDPFLYSSSPASRAFSDDDSTISRRNETSDQSDSEATKSTASEASNSNRKRGGLQKGNRDHGPEKIKLRLKLEKSEPITVSFVNSPTSKKPLPVSGNRITGTSGPSGCTLSNSNNGNAGSNVSPALTNVTSGSNACISAVGNANSAEEPRVPPLHISLRGPNSAVVVSNRKEKKSPSHWGQTDEENRFSLDSPNDPTSDLYSKLNKKKVKVSNLKIGREVVAMNSSSELNPKSKKLKLKRVADRDVDNVLKLKIPVGATVNDMSDDLDALDEKLLLKKRKDSKKQKNNIIGANKKHMSEMPDAEVTRRFDDIMSTVNKRVELNLKMDSEEWISRTLKEETLNYEKRKNCSKLIDDFERLGKKETDSDLGESDSLKSFDIRKSLSENDSSGGSGGGVIAGLDAEEERTKGFKTGSFELSDLLRRKKVADLSKKVKSLECLNIKGDFVKHKYMELTELAEERAERSGDEVTVKKPQEIGGKIKSELTSKIDRVSGKLKNDLSLKFPKDGVNKKLKFDESGLKKLKLDEFGKALKKSDKTSLRMKSAKKDLGGLRLGGLGNSDGEDDHESFSRAQKRRHSGDQTITEIQTAQKVKSRSSSSDQLSPGNLTKTGNSSRRFESLGRKIRKDSVIDRLRKEKLNKVFALNRKMSVGNEAHNKRQTVNRVGVVKQLTPVKASTESLCPVKEAVTNLCETKTSAVTSLGESDLVKVNKHADSVESPSNPAVGGESPANQGNTQGEDSGIESMDALSEKSPNQGESPCRKEESHTKELEISKPEEKKGQNHDRTEEASKSEENSCLNKSKSIQNNPAQANVVPLDGPGSRAVDSKANINNINNLNYINQNSPQSTNKLDEVMVVEDEAQDVDEEEISESKTDFHGKYALSQHERSNQNEELRVSGHNQVNSQSNDCDDSESAIETNKTSAEVLPKTKDEKSSAIEEADVTNLLMETFESKIREAFMRNENKEFDTTAEGLGAKILETSSRLEDKGKETGGFTAINDSAEGSKNSEAEIGSPLLEDIERFRVNPPLYTYAKREDSLSPSPPIMENSDFANSHIKNEQSEDDCNGYGKKKLNKRLKSSEEPEDAISSPIAEVKSNKSLLEQLLIEIPGEDSRKTRSWHRLGSSPSGTPRSSPRSLKDERPLSPPVAKTSPKNAIKLSPIPRNKRKFESATEEKGKTESAETRPNKRKCSENAAELIKACMGVDDRKQLLKLVQPVTGQKKGGAEIESSDDEPLIDLTGKGRSREHSVEEETKKPKLAPEEENRNNNKVSTKNPQGNALCKTGAEPPTRRSIRQHIKSDPRNIRYTRSAITQESSDVNKRRRTSRDGK